MEGGLRGGIPFGSYEHDEINGSRTPELQSLVESSPSTGAFGDVMKLPSTSSPKRSRRSLQRRVVSIPIKDTEGSRLKGEGAPPSDSWAWRKYGQKPIKGSPYPRGYYRCSSSKGCPARKQVERSRDDPTMLVITYSNEHNHPWPAPRNNNHHHHHHNHKSPNPSAAASETSPAAAEASPIEEKPEVAMGTPDLEPEPEPEPELEPEEKFTEMSTDEPSPLLPPPPHVDEFSWFTDMQTTSSALLDSPFFAESSCNNIAARDGDVAMFFPMREEDESLFADLGELPECSVVFRHRDMGTQVQIC